MIRIVRITFLFLLVLLDMKISAQTDVWSGGRELWNTGSGTASDPYLIESADNLAFLAYLVNKGYDMDGICFRLATDLDLGGERGFYWEPIGLGDRWSNEDGCDRGVFDSTVCFRGCFDGGYHVVSNVCVEDRFSNSGLFGFVAGRIDAPAVIEKVSVVNGVIKGGKAGGIVGKGVFTQISKCWNGAVVEGTVAGGIVGWSEGCFISNCYNIGNVLGDGEDSVAGGLVGISQNAVQLISSYNVGEISGAMLGCLLGGVINGPVVVENSHYLNTCNQGEYGTPQSEAFMRTMEFVDILNASNPGLVWDSDENYVNNGFPVLNDEIFSIEVLANPSSGGVVQGGGSYDIGESCIVSAHATPGFVFVNWTEDEEIVSNDSLYSFPVMDNRQLVANFLLETLGIPDETDREVLLEVFPNPARDVLFIRGENHSKVTLLNELGQIMDIVEIGCEGLVRISLKNYEPGIYLIKTHLKDRAVVRFIKD